MMHLQQPSHFLNLRNDAHFGDVLITLNLIYNISIRKKFKIHLYCGNRRGMVEEFMSVFDYGETIELIQDAEIEAHVDFSFATFLNAKENTNWSSEIFGKSTIHPFHLDRFVLPRSKMKLSKVGGYRCCQLDGRSPQQEKPLMSELELSGIFMRFYNGNVYHVGGSDSTFKINGIDNYHGSIEELSKFIYGCDMFFGVDSGMSHLAGTLGVKMEVFIQSKIEDYASSVEDAYRFMYSSNVRTHRRETIFSNLLA